MDFPFSVTFQCVKPRSLTLSIFNLMHLFVLSFNDVCLLNTLCLTMLLFSKPCVWFETWTKKKKREKIGIIHFLISGPVLQRFNQRWMNGTCDVWGLKNIHFSFPPWKAWVQADPYIKIYQRKSFDGTLKWKEPYDWRETLQKKKKLGSFDDSMP